MACQNACCDKKPVKILLNVFWDDFVNKHFIQFYTILLGHNVQKVIQCFVSPFSVKSLEIKLIF